MQHPRLPPTNTPRLNQPPHDRQIFSVIALSTPPTESPPPQQQQQQQQCQQRSQQTTTNSAPSPNIFFYSRRSWYNTVESCFEYEIEWPAWRITLAGLTLHSCYSLLLISAFTLSLSRSSSGVWVGGFSAIGATLSIVAVLRKNHCLNTAVLGLNLLACMCAVAGLVFTIVELQSASQTTKTSLTKFLFHLKIAEVSFLLQLLVALIADCVLNFCTICKPKPRRNQRVPQHHRTSGQQTAQLPDVYQIEQPTQLEDIYEIRNNGRI